MVALENARLEIDHIYSDITRCRICGEQSEHKGYLYRCRINNFCSSHWDQRKLREDYGEIFKKRSFDKNKKLIKDSIKKILEKSGVGSVKSKSVYILRLSDKFIENNGGGFKPSCYVGMTGLPVEERMLNHIRGYKTGQVNTKKFTRSLVYFENNFTEERAKNREKELRDIMEKRGWNAKGGH